MNILKITQGISVFCIFILSGCTINSQQFLSRIIEEKPFITQENDSRVVDVFKENLKSEYYPSLIGFQNSSRYFIQLTLNEEVNHYSGHQQTNYTNQENIPLDKILFLLIPNSGGDYLKVSNILVNNNPVLSEISFQNNVLGIHLNKPIMPRESIEISMDFSGTVPEQIGGNYGLYIFQEEILALDSFFPIIPVFDEEGWNVQNPPRNADMIYTDAAFFEVCVDAPKDLVLVASGSEVGKAIKNDRQIVTFAGGPQRDFYLAASTRYQSASKQAGDVKITSYFPEEFSKSGEMVLDTAEKALIVFSRRYGPYPYTELDLVSTPMQAGGMEYSGAAAMALGLYKIGNTKSGSPNSVFLEFATVHEVAHQWFFNQVMNDQIKEPWLDEGLAQYLTYVYYLDTYGSEAAEQIYATFEKYWSRVDMQPIPIGMPAAEYDPVEYAAIIYGRAPLFILELEKEMGAEVFTHFLADYVSTYQWKTVDTQQFQSLAQKTCDCDLTSLFKKWWAFD